MMQIVSSKGVFAALLTTCALTNASADSYSTGSGCFISSNEVLTAYDYGKGTVAFDDARSAALLIGEKHGVMMKNTRAPTYVSGQYNPIGTRVDDSLLPFEERDFQHWGTIKFWFEHIDATVMGEWEYISWPNYYSQKSNYERDQHHTVSVTIYEYQRRDRDYSTFAVWIGLTGTEEIQFAANESNAKERDTKRHQDALDAL